MASNVGRAPHTKLLAGLSATTASHIVDFDVAYKDFTVVVTAGAGTSAGTVTVTLSHDGTNFWAPASNTIASSSAGTTAATFVDVPARFVKLAISVAFVGGTLTAASVAAA